MNETPTSTAPLALLDGKYQLVRQLGQGGMGTVYEARHKGTGRRCAVKVIAGEALAKSADIVGRFQREAMASGAIESKYIAHVMDTGVDSETGSPYMVMELLVGEDLEQSVKRLGPLPPDVALRITAQACLGLQKAHEAGVVHRDIKPANIYLARLEDGEVLAKILDFGVAKVRADPLATVDQNSLTRTGTMLGSPLYMSPEQALGKKTVDHRTDLWSLGVVLYEALTGSTPHNAETVGALIMQICSLPPPPVQERAPWVAPEIAAVVHRALASEPDARFGSAGDMYAAIRAILPAHTLEQSMIVSLTPEAKEVEAPRFSMPGSTTVATGLAKTLATAEASGPVQASTTAGVAGEVPLPSLRPRSSRAVPLALGGVAVAAAALVGAWSLAARSHPAVVATGLVETPSAIAPEQARQAPTSVLPVDRATRLVVLPADVHTEVDGIAVSAAGGTVPVVGPLGSTHHVRVSSGGREKIVDVVIAEEGVVPALVDLGPPPPPVAQHHVTVPASASAVTPPTPPVEKKRTLQMEMK